MLYIYYHRVLPATAFKNVLSYSCCHVAVIHRMRHVQISHGYYSSAYKVDREVPYRERERDLKQGVAWIFFLSCSDIEMSFKDPKLI